MECELFNGLFFRQAPEFKKRRKALRMVPKTTIRESEPEVRTTATCPRLKALQTI